MAELIFIFRSGFLIAARGRFSYLSGFIFFIVVAVSFLASFFSGRQSPVVALDIGISVIKLLYPVFILLLAQEVFSQEFSRKLYLCTLTYPVSRQNWFLGRVLVVSILSAALLILSALLLALLVHILAKMFPQATAPSLAQNYLITLCFILTEMLVLVTVICFLALIASAQSFLIIAVFGFVVVGRSYSTILGLLQQNSDIVSDGHSYSLGISLLGFLVPDLGVLDVRAIALYADVSLMPADWGWDITSCLVFSLAILALSLWYFRFKRFS